MNRIEKAKKNYERAIGWAALALVAFLLCSIAAIWLGDWRPAGTAGILFVFAVIVAVGALMKFNDALDEANKSEL